MNINDFVVLPGSKTGTSVKLKVKNVRELKLEKVQLELENREMETKLQQLQSNMSREKEERRERSSGYRWQSGQAGPMGIQPQGWSQNKENVKASSGKVKLKILKEQIHEPVKQPFIHKMANAAIPEKHKVKGKACGQCENKNALLVCLECGEDYCGSCFAKVHQKGALKLHRMIPLQAKTHMPVKKLEATHQFMKGLDPDESKENHEQKKTISKNQLISDSSSSLLTSTGNAEEVSSVPTVFENQNSGLLLHGTFDEEESAESFQEALTQWRNGNHEHKKEQNSDEAKPDSMGVCEVQTNITILREPVKIEFREESLNYMEKLWLKKHRRMPFDQIPHLQVDEFRLKHEFMNETHGALNEGDGDDDDYLIVEDMKKYWKALFRAEESDTVPKNLESALKIEILSDSCEEDLDESCNSVILEVGSTKLSNEQSDAMPENQKDTISDFLPEPAADVTSGASINSVSTADKKNLFNPHDRSTIPQKEISKGKFVSSARTSTMNNERIYTDCIHSSKEETLLSSHNESAITKKESIKAKTYRRSLRACMSPEKTIDLPKLGSNEPSPMTRSLKNNKESLEFNSLHTSKNLDLPVTTGASVLLQEVARREKPILTQYQGLEGFFILHANSKQVTIPSPFSDYSSTNNSTSVSGTGHWFRDTSLSEYADDCIVQDVLQRELSRSSSNLELQNLRTGVSPWTLKHSSPIDKNSFRRPLSANIPPSKSMKCDRIHCSLSQRRPRSLTTQPLSRPAITISKIESIESSEKNDPLLEYTADQQALAGLENELKSQIDPQEKLYSFTPEDLSAFSQHSKKISENITDFHNNLEIKDHSKVAIFGDWDESHTDEEEEILRDKQEVIALR
nr:zinc finger B-box domain-containing protein 1 isoform X1 [Pelodiscus sinensis]XP_025042856.1 zinc finger B-box domain-containing protein 1 isoform X1 [Pelodiscus sinensis]XP_025042857.1 zinc finger B-box domain-containing protein 1 isoform X1 [Pelodiscus sinensis]|eukprot:XP_014431299.1 zinc finger B-box domain-containing protein 1 isoform X1 [Pelodiscus sinensis]